MKRTEWVAEVKKELTLRHMDMADLAKELGVSHGYIRNLVAGCNRSQGGVNKISKYLNIYPFETGGKGSANRK